MQEITDIDNEITPLSERIRALAGKVKFTEICMLSDEAEISKLSFKGIYLIEVKTNGGTYESWVNDFINRWDLPELKDKFTCTSKNKRIKCHAKHHEWMPIYLGKSENIASRVSIHLNSPIEKKTFALKIKSRINMNNEIFKLSVVKLDIDNYSFIAPALESALRNLIHPIIGKQ